MSFHCEISARIKIKAEFLEDFVHLYNEEYSEITNPVIKAFVDEHYTEERRKEYKEITGSAPASLKDILGSTPVPLKGDVLEYHLSYTYFRNLIEEDFGFLLSFITEKEYKVHSYDEMRDESPYYVYLETSAIKMEAGALFSIVSDKVDNGDVCGDGNCIRINGQEITLEIKGLNEWNSRYVNEVLIPCETGEKHIEEINKIFDWKKFNEEGIRFAQKVKESLPYEVKLEYASPFECPETVRLSL